MPPTRVVAVPPPPPSRRPQKPEVPAIPVRIPPSKALGAIADWDKLRIFHAVAEAGSFTHAGDVLGLSQSAVSRQIAALEESLDVALFHRHARGLVLTEQGELLYRIAQETFAKLAMTAVRIRESKDRPQGPLRIMTTVAFGSVWLTPRLKEFNDVYPEISLGLFLEDAEPDLSLRRADVAIQMFPARQPDLIQRHLATFRYGLYATQDYLQKHSVPQTPADLDNHALIVYGEDGPRPLDRINWPMQIGMPAGKRRRAILKVNNIYGIFRAVQSGMGVGMLPHYMSRENRNLVELLPDLRGQTLDVYFVYPEELRQSKRVTVFRDFLLRKIAEAKL